MDVGGQHFEVVERVGEPGVYDLRWVTGLNQGNGFASAKYGGEGQIDAELDDAIHNFLSQVDPTTGYIE